jgi:hypothetical protein
MVIADLPGSSPDGRTTGQVPSQLASPASRPGDYFDSPEQAARRLYRLWRNDNLGGALRFSSKRIGSMFRNTDIPRDEWRFGSCVPHHEAGEECFWQPVFPVGIGDACLLDMQIVPADAKGQRVTGFGFTYCETG